MYELDRNNLSLLAVFDYVHTRLKDQGCASVDSFDTCLYRGPDGAKCAAGWLISDDNYTNLLEGNTVDTDKVWAAINLPDHYKPLVVQLQEMHDNILRRNLGNWDHAMHAMRAVLVAYVPNA